MIRDPDGYIYLRERDGCILAGGFEPIAKPVYEEESEYTCFVEPLLTDAYLVFKMAAILRS